MGWHAMQWESARIMHFAWNANRDTEKSIRISEMLNRQFFIPFGYRTQCTFIYIEQWAPAESDMLREKNDRKREPLEKWKKTNSVGSRKKYNLLKSTESVVLDFALLIKVAPRYAIVSERRAVCSIHKKSIWVSKLTTSSQFKFSNSHLHKQFNGTSFYVLFLLLHIKLCTGSEYPTILYRENVCSYYSV